MISQSLSAIQQEFGSMGVQTVHLIQEALPKHEPELALAYDSSSRKITVLNSSDIPSAVLQEHLYANNCMGSYKSWVPRVEEQRTDGQNLQISLISQLYPDPERVFSSESSFAIKIKPLVHEPSISMHEIVHYSSLPINPRIEEIKKAKCLTAEELIKFGQDVQERLKTCIEKLKQSNLCPDYSYPR